MPHYAETQMRTGAMHPKPDHGEESYRSSGRLKDKKAVVTGADSGIGRAVALAFARGANVLISDLNEHEDARETKRLVEEAGRKAVLMAGDIGEPAHCRVVVGKVVAGLGGLDLLVNNATHQAIFESTEDISDGEWQLTFNVNIHAMFCRGQPAELATAFVMLADPRLRRYYRSHRR